MRFTYETSPRRQHDMDKDIHSYACPVLFFNSPAVRPVWLWIGSGLAHRHEIHCGWTELELTKISIEVLVLSPYFNREAVSFIGSLSAIPKGFLLALGMVLLYEVSRHFDAERHYTGVGYGFSL